MEQVKLSRLKAMYSKLINLDIWKTIYINFHSFPLREALRFPIFVYGKTEIRNTRRIACEEPLSTGSICIGKNVVGFMANNIRTIWNVKGCLQIGG